jgi:prepilin-type N-terminal cleavage/methylation domain-containing protein
MSINTRRSSGFTLIELLVVVLILGILLAIANSNAKSIATAVQASYVKNGGSLGYNVAPMSDLSGSVLLDMGGAIPNNPCSGVTGAGGYTVATPDATHWSITPLATNCTTAPGTVSLSQ